MRISLEQTILPNGLTISHLLKRNTIWFGGTKTFSAEKVLHEKLMKFTKIVNYICIKTSRIVFAAKNPDILVIYIAYKTNRQVLV